MTRTMDPYDELASMFLTQPDDSGSGGGRPAVIELLVVGHLPVRAGLWLTPYADAVARQLGPTVLLRLDRDEPILQVLRGEAETAAAPAGRSLRQTIQELAGGASAWIVFCSDSTPTELVSGGPDRVTILSSADDAAVVAAYQHVKQLAGAAEAQQTTVPAVGLAVLGADEDAARRVYDRVNRTTTAFLGIELELIGVLPKMDAAVRSTSYVNFPGERGPAVGEVLGWIADARKRLSAQPPAAAETREAASAAAPSAGGEGPVHDGATGDTPDVSEQERELLHEAPREETQRPAAEATQPQPPQPQRGEEPAEHEPPLVEYVAYQQPKEHEQAQRQYAEQQSYAQEHQRRPARVIPRPQMELEPKRPAEAREPDHDGQPVPLSSHVCELTPIAPRCPNHERIELAVGRTGRVHLLGHVQDLRNMHYVQSWAKLHHELLSMACPNVTIDPAARPVCHVFTDKPVDVSDLHGCDLKLHVLAPVDANGQRAWYAAPLN